MAKVGEKKAPARTVKTYISSMRVYRPTGPDPRGDCIELNPGRQFQAYSDVKPPSHWTEVKK